MTRSIWDFFCCVIREIRKPDSVPARSRSLHARPLRTSISTPIEGFIPAIPRDVAPCTSRRQILVS
jgi:hypothetical protein